MILEGKIFPYRKKVKNLFDIAGDVLGENFTNVNVSVNLALIQLY